MELSSFQRVIAFVVVVLVLVGLGLWLFLPQSSAASGSPRPPHASARPQPSGQPSASQPPASQQPPGPGTADIYQWVPFTQAGLASAARLATRFATDYGTFSYQESTAAYLAPMQPIAQSQLVQLIGRAYAVPGLVATRTNGKQVAVATAAIQTLRAFGQTSLTFVVQVTQKISAAKGNARKTINYAITVTGTGISWQVSDVEPAGEGNN